VDPFSGFLTLLFVLDPWGNIPVFLSVLKGIEGRRRYFVIFRESLIALVIMLLFLLFGSRFLTALDLEQSSVQIAGAIVLFLIALRMIFPSEGGIMGEDLIDGEPFIVPLAVPLVAGPSTLALLMLMAHSTSTDTITWIIVLLGAWSISSFFLMLSPLLYKILHKRGLVAVERLMGMILVIIAVQNFLSGMRVFLSTSTA
jgi:multiple antibiotic resistance protein